MTDIFQIFPKLILKKYQKTSNPDILCLDKKKNSDYNPSWPLEKGYQKYIEWYKDLFKRHPIYLNKNEE